ncbi:MAG: hypothetical protein K6G87_02145 [Butyrivibrio sp.]|uniref:hypothetical protein n=1 Tax=Butyrivibrio sp. TaxID=28121 RepID=UPI0025F3F9F3|nr:hypothetical protein [Butyrivibrio sp.]MCR5770016.1 hypothetical protein [Butyrivibrio sp.]
MNMKFVKKMLTVSLAAALVVMPMTAFATTDSSSDETTSTVTTSTSSNSSDSSDTYVAPEGVSFSSQATIGGKVVKSSVPGSYQLGTTVKAVVFTQSLDGLKAAAGMTGTERPYARVYESNAKKSPLALETANWTASVLGKTLLSDTGININLGKMTDGKFSSLTDSVKTPVTIALKGDAAGATSVIAVGPNGVVEFIDATNDGAGNVTFEAIGGQHTYYFVK